MDNIIENYKKTRRKANISFFAILIIIILTVIFFLGLGAMDISAKEICSIILSKITGNEAFSRDIKGNVQAVIWELRLPRIAASLFVGAGLAVAGAVFQSILMNPLADPYTLGISTGSAFGASIAIYFNMTRNLKLPVPVMALIFGMATLVTVIIISKKGGGSLTSNLIIAGIIASAFLSSGISFIKMMAGENVGAIVFWLMGSLSSKTWSDIKIMIPVVLVCIILAFIFSRYLNLMSMGEREAESLGVNVKKVRIFYMIISSVITAFCVSVCGIIGFVGLIVPHMLRLIFSGDNTILIPLSSVTGALLMLLADNAARLIAGGEIPVGVLTTLLGGPFFIWLFMKRGGR